MNMASDQSTEPAHPRPVHVPVGLGLTTLLGLLTLGAPSYGLEGVPRDILGLLTVFFLPGFALVVALFPGFDHRHSILDPLSYGEAEARESSVSNVERLVLSVGLSLATVPLVGLVLNFTPWLIREDTVLFALGGTTVVLALLAAARWLSVPPERRYRVRVRSGLSRGWVLLRSGGTAFEVGVNVLFVVGLVVASSGIAFAVLAPNDGEQYTELSVLAPDPETGALTADDYPEVVERGQSTELVFGVTNREDRTVDYTVVVVLQDLNGPEGASSVQREQTLDRFTRTLQSGESWDQTHEFSPDMTGEQLRLTYLLYAGDPPAEPSVENAYRQVHIWVTVTDTESGDEAGGTS